MSTNKADTAFQIHDLRSKISAAVSFIELLERESPQAASSHFTQSLKECLQSAIDSSAELSLTLSADPTEQDNSGERMMLAPAKDVAGVHAAKAYEALARQYPIAIHFSCKLIEGDQLVAMQARQIASIRENVIANAVASGATNLNIFYEMKDYGLRISMSDNGKGMDSEELDRLRLLMLGDGRVHGLGTRSIFSSVEAHDAAVNYDSVVGEGTTVTILCPYVTGDIDLDQYEKVSLDEAPSMRAS